MNPVIARLVLRAMTAAGGIRPRLPSRFEGHGTPAPDGAGSMTVAADAPPLSAAPSGIRASGSQHSTSDHDDTQRVADRTRAPVRAATDTATDVSAIAATSPPGMPEHVVPLAATAPVRETEPASRIQRAPAPPTPLVPMAPVHTDSPSGRLRPALPVFPLPVGPAVPTREPDVEISIGRIEVRVPPPPPPRRVPRAQPRMMTLEDYLSRGRRTR